MPRVVHFEIAADDPERAARFYQQVFDWQVHKWDGPMDYWLLRTGEGAGIDGALARRGDVDQPVTNVVEVDDLDACVARIEASGGAVLSPKHAVPGVGWTAYCSDTEGNVFGLMQNDPDAR